MNAFIDLIRNHGTKILGFFGVTIGVLAVADPELVGGPKMVKYFLLLQSLLTVWRGFFNTDAIKTADAVKSSIQSGAVNITNKAGGFARLSALVLVALLGFGAVTLLVTPGCTHTREAYHEADNISETAYVVAEHYASLVHEAAKLKEAGNLDEGIISSMQAADRVANPVVHKLREARDIYVRDQDAKAETELRAALNDASSSVADMNRQVKKARGDNNG